MQAIYTRFFAPTLRNHARARRSRNRLFTLDLLSRSPRYTTPPLSAAASSQALCDAMTAMSAPDHRPLAQRRALYSRLAAARNEAPRGEERDRADVALARCGRRLAAALAAAEKRQRKSAAQRAALARLYPAPPSLVRALLARTTLRAWCRRLRRDMRAQRKAMHALADAAASLDTAARLADSLRDRNANQFSSVVRHSPRRRNASDADRPLDDDVFSPPPGPRRRAAAFRIRVRSSNEDEQVETASSLRWRPTALRVRLRSTHESDVVKRCLSATPPAVSAHELTASKEPIAPAPRLRRRARRIFSALTAAEAERDTLLGARAVSHENTLCDEAVRTHWHAAERSVDIARTQCAYLARRLPTDFVDNLHSLAAQPSDSAAARDQRDRVEQARRRVARFARFCAEEHLALSACVTELTDYIHGARAELAEQHLVVGCSAFRVDPGHVCSAACKVPKTAEPTLPLPGIALAAASELFV